MDDLSVDDWGELNIPENYAWCMDCQALTPHDTKETLYPGDRIDIFTNCRICDRDINHLCRCPECGWDAENIILEDTGPVEEKIHVEGCPWIEYFRLINRPDFDSYYNDPEEPEECHCEKVFIYPNPWCFNHWSRSVFSLDVTNGMEFGCSIRCQICGTIFEHSDSNF